MKIAKSEKIMIEKETNLKDIYYKIKALNHSISNIKLLIFNSKFTCNNCRNINRNTNGKCNRCFIINNHGNFLWETFRKTDREYKK